MNEVVEKNLRRMTGEKEGDMPYLLCRESIGGNAGMWKGLPCQAANFYFSKWTGEIVYFGNIQNVPAETRQGCAEGALRLAMNYKERKYRIIGLNVSGKISEEAKKNINKTIDEYNRNYGFKVIA